MQIFTYLALVLTISSYWSQLIGTLIVLSTKEGKSGTLGFWTGTLSLCATIALGVHVGW